MSIAEQTTYAEIVSRSTIESNEPVDIAVGKCRRQAARDLLAPDGTRPNYFAIAHQLLSLAECCTHPEPKTEALLKNLIRRRLTAIVAAVDPGQFETGQDSGDGLSPIWRF